MGDLIYFKSREPDMPYPPPGVAFWCAGCKRWVPSPAMMTWDWRLGIAHCGCKEVERGL